ncbi:MAG: DUF2997 domain-containing protein [Thermoproteota archaeon]
MKQIKFEIRADGSLSIKTEGFVGKECTEVTEELLAKLKQLGIEASTQSIEYSPEYYVEKSKTKVSVR